MTGIQLSGLGSGLDTQSIIDQLMQVESQPRVGLQNKQSIATAKQTALNDIRAKLVLLQSAAQSLGSVGTWADTQTAASSDPTRITATRTGGAAPGGHTLEVSLLATADQHTYDYTAPAADTDLTVNGAAVHLSAGATIDDAVSAINESDTAKVYAVNVGNRLVLAAKDTGVAARFTASGAGVLNEDLTAARPGIDASYVLDGKPGGSGSNVLSGVIPGLDITLQSTTTSPVTVTVGTPAPSTDAIVSAVKSFVSSYNDVVDAIRSRTTEKTVVNPQNSSDVIKGSLFGDTGLTSILSSLRGSLQTALNGNPTGFQMLGDLGISTGAVSATVNADSVAGKLTLDEDKLRGALASNPTAVKKLLGGAVQTKGFAQAVAGVLSPLVQAGGVMDGRLSSVGSDLKDIADSLARFDDRMDQRRTLLEKQYTALELALSNNNSLASTVQQGLSRLM